MTNVFLKKIENARGELVLHVLRRTHQSLTIKHDDGKTTKRTPAMAAGIATYPWGLTRLAQLLD